MFRYSANAVQSALPRRRWSVAILFVAAMLATEPFTPPAMAQGMAQPAGPAEQSGEGSSSSGRAARPRGAGAATLLPSADLDASAEYYRGYRDALRDTAQMRWRSQARTRADWEGQRTWPDLGDRAGRTSRTTDRDGVGQSRRNTERLPDEREPRRQAATAREPGTVMMKDEAATVRESNRRQVVARGDHQPPAAPPAEAAGPAVATDDPQRTMRPGDTVRDATPRP